MWVCSVTRIRLRNFMTHKDITIFPSGGLNMVLGPNGSGKSSIVVALFVALGGNVGVSI